MGKISGRTLADVFQRLSPEVKIGIGIGVLGIDIKPEMTLKITESDKQKAGKLLTFLESRRVLYEDPEWEHVGYSIQSVIQIRDYIKQELANSKRKSRFKAYLKELVEGCQEYLTLTQKLEKSESGFYEFQTSNYRILRA